VRFVFLGIFRAPLPAGFAEMELLRSVRLIIGKEDFMEPAIDRIILTYDLLLNRTAAASAEARAKVTAYLAMLMEAGEKDTHRLTVCGLTFLREFDGSSDPVKAGFTGL
jgi:hypothetical protein